LLAATNSFIQLIQERAVSNNSSN